MLYIDMTGPLAPILYGMDVALVVAGAALFAIAAAPRLRTWLRQRDRRQVVLSRPVYAGQGTR